MVLRGGDRLEADRPLSSLKTQHNDWLLDFLPNVESPEDSYTENRNDAEPVARKLMKTLASSSGASIARSSSTVAGYGCHPH